MSRFGEWQGYTGEPCKNCGRYRVEHYSSGFEICEKCRWCEQFHKYIPDDEFYEDDFLGGEKRMTTEEAIKYLIIPTATSTKPSAEYLKQKEAYELAIKALGERPKDYDSNGDIIPMGCKEEKEDVFTRKEELSKEESE